MVSYFNLSAVGCAVELVVSTPSLFNPDNTSFSEMGLDTLVGLGMLLVATAVFLYYTAWTFLLPFVIEDSPIVQLFPPREWIIRIPALLLLAAVAVVGTFIGSVLIKSEKKRQLKAAAKKNE